MKKYSKLPITDEIFLKGIKLLSEGEMAKILGVRDLSEIREIKNKFVKFVEDTISKKSYINVEDAWRDFMKTKDYKTYDRYLKISKKVTSSLISKKPKVGEQIRFLSSDGLMTVDKIYDVFGDEVETDKTEETFQIDDLKWKGTHWEYKK